MKVRHEQRNHDFQESYQNFLSEPLESRESLETEANTMDVHHNPALKGGNQNEHFSRAIPLHSIEVEI